MPMTNLLLSPVGPAIILLAAGALLRVLPPLRRASLLALAALFPLSVALILLTRLRATEVADLTSTWWPLVVAPLRVHWALDGWNWLMTLLLLVISVCALLLTWRGPGVRASSFHGLSLLLVGGAALTVVSDNLLTLSSVWVATDVLLVARVRSGRATAGEGLGGLEAIGSLLLFLGIGITSLAAATAPFEAAPLPAETVALLMLVAALRMAVYPLHLWSLAAGDTRDRGTQLLISGVGLITGAWLLGQVYPLGAAYWLAHPVWRALFAALVIAAGAATWTSANFQQFALLFSSRATWIWLAVALAAPAVGRDVLGWAVVTVILGLSLSAVGMSVFDLWRWRVPLVLSLGTLAGVPLTAGLAAQALTPAPNWLIWLFVALGEGLALSAVAVAWQNAPAAAVNGGDELAAPPRMLLNWPVVRMLLAFGVTSILTLLWGIRPEALASFAGFSISPSLTDLLAIMRWFQWLSIGGSIALAVALAAVWARPDSAAPRWRPTVAGALSLRWAVNGLLWLWAWVGEAGRVLFATVEGEGYLGWIVLVFLVVWLIIRA